MGDYVFISMINNNIMDIDYIKKFAEYLKMSEKDAF